MRFLTSLGFVVHILVSGCADREVKGFQEIQNIAGKHNVVWDVERAFPKKVVSKSGKVTLRPCNADDTEHQNLFIHLYTQKEALKMYLDGSVRTEEEALNLLNSHSARWDQGLLLSGFVGYSPNNLPFVHCGIGVFPAKHLAEVFILELPDFRGKGLGSEVMDALNSWGHFLKAMGPSVFPNGDKPGVHTLIARVSPENIASLKLLLSAGFTTDFSLDRLKKEFGDYEPTNGKITEEELKVEGVSYRVKVITTKRRPTPKVILIKRL